LSTHWGMFSGTGVAVSMILPSSTSFMRVMNSSMVRFLRA